MKLPRQIIPGELTTFEVELDDETVARLMTVSEVAKLPPGLLLASLIHDVLADDEAAHGDGVDGADPLAHKHLN